MTEMCLKGKAACLFADLFPHDVQDAKLTAVEDRLSALESAAELLRPISQATPLDWQTFEESIRHVVCEFDASFSFVAGKVPMGPAVQFGRDAYSCRDCVLREVHTC